MDKIQEIKERYEVGYTMARYGTREAIHEQMNKDIAELLEQVKNIAYEPVLASVIDKRLDQLDKDIENSKPFSQSFMNLKEREAQLLKAKSLLERDGLL